MEDTTYSELVTIETIPEIGRRLKALLEGACYTHVLVEKERGFRPEVQTGVRLQYYTVDGETGGGITVNEKSITVSDTYGVWGMSPAHVEGDDEFSFVVSFAENQVTVSVTVINEVKPYIDRWFIVAAVEASASGG